MNPFGGRHQRRQLAHARAVHPSTVTVLLPQLEAAAQPDCWCGSPATLIAFVHQIDYCTSPGLTPPNSQGVPAGCEVHFVCARDSRLLGQFAAADIEKRLSLVTGEFACLTCDKTIDSLHSVMETAVL